MSVLAAIGSAWSAYRKARATQRRRVRFFRAALAYNRLHTYEYQPVKSPGGHGRGSWMCPTCNHIHKQSGFCFFSGRQFPACCEFSEGERLSRACAT